MSATTTLPTQPGRASHLDAMQDGFNRVLRSLTQWDDRAEDPLDEVSCAIVRAQQFLAMLGGLRSITPARSATADQLDMWTARLRVAISSLRQQECEVMLSPDYREDLAPDGDLSSRISETHELTNEGE